MQRDALRPLARLSALSRPALASGFLALGLAFLAARDPLSAVRAQAGPPDDWRLVGDWRSFANGEDLRALATGDGEVWAASHGGGVLRWSREGKVLRQYLAPQDGLPCNDVRDLIRWRGAWYAATCGGLAVLEPGKERFAVVDAGVASTSLTALAVDDRDRLWVGSEQVWDPEAQVEGAGRAGAWVGGGLALTPDLVQWSAFRQADGLPSENIRDIALWRGSMWVATEPYRRWQPASGSGEQAQEGHWAWTGGGVAQRSGAAWTRYDSGKDSSLSDAVRHLVPGPQALWAGTWGRGLAAFDGAKWTAYRDCGNARRCLQSDYVSALALGADDAIWVGMATFNGQGKGLALLDSRGTPAKSDDDAWYLYRATDGLPSDLIRAILPDADASAWLAPSKLAGDGQSIGLGLARLLPDRQSFRSHRAGPEAGAQLPDNEVTALARHPVSGDLWVGTARAGLAVRDEAGRWRHHSRASTGGLLGSDSIADIVIEPGGIVWVATRQTQYDAAKNRWLDGGLSRWDGSLWQRVGTAEGLPSNHLSSLALDGQGRLWIGSGATDRGPKELAYRGAGLALWNLQTRRLERRYTFGDLLSDNITDLLVAGGKVYASSAYFFFVDNRPGGAQLNLGGGLNIFDLTKETWQRIGAAEGLTPVVKDGGTQARPLIDLRSLALRADGSLWVGGMAYAGGVFDPDRRPDAIVEELAPDLKVKHHRFSEAGALRVLAVDGADRVWAGTAEDGLRILHDGSWMEERAHSGGLPSASLSALLLDGEKVWFGSSADGLYLLAPPPPPTPETPGTGPHGTDRLFRRYPYRLFLPRVQEALEPRFVTLP